MNREDIMKLAREAGYEPKVGWELAFDLWDFDFERFAAIVAAAEREACAKVCEEIAEHWIQEIGCITFSSDAANECAEAIRARGEK